MLLLAWARARGIALLQRDGTLWAGIGAGLLFAGEFVIVYAGLEHAGPLTGYFAVAALLVGVGIVLVNLRR